MTSTRQLPLLDMREGLAYLRSAGKMNAAVQTLELCSEKYGGCDDCPDLRECKKAFDARVAPQKTQQ